MAIVHAQQGDAAVHAIVKHTSDNPWLYRTPGVKTNGTPMTYSIEGHQHVVIALGDRNRCECLGVQHVKHLQYSGEHVSAATKRGSSSKVLWKEIVQCFF